MPSFDDVLVSLYFFLPGYIFHWVRETIVSRHLRSDARWAAEALVVSVVFWLALKVYLGGDLTTAYVNDHPARLALAGVALPAACGLLVDRRPLTWLRGRIRWLDRCASKIAGWARRLDISSNNRNPHPRAWDFRFHSRKKLYVLVWLTDGTRIGGLFGNHSSASSFPSPEDLFLEKVYRLDSEGRFGDEVAGSAGVLGSLPPPVVVPPPTTSPGTGSGSSSGSGRCCIAR